MTWVDAIVGRDSDEETPVARLSYSSAAEIQPTRPEWLWEGWVLRRAVNLLVGRQGAGKTTFVIYVLAALTTGRPMPDASISPDPIRVGFLSLEEPPDRVAARLHASAAELGKIIVVGDVEDFDDDGNPYRRRWTLPKDISALGKLITEQSLDLVVVDGLGYSISGDSHNYAVVGSALAALSGEADRTGAAIVGLTHPPKGSSDPVTAAIGSTAWTAIPRISIVLGDDPNDDSGKAKVVRVAKTNYKPPASGLSFTIGTDPEWECGFVASIRTSNVAAEDITAAAPTTEERGERANARALLKQLLAEGSMDAKEIERATGISERTLRRARNDLGVITEPRRNDRGRVVGWTWRLPGQPHGHTASTTRPTDSWPSGPTGHTQDKQCVSATPGGPGGPDDGREQQEVVW